MEEPRKNQHDAPRKDFNFGAMDETNTQPPILKFAARLKLPESTRGRKRKDREPEPPRPKSEEELREDSAWRQVAETGKPVVLDQTLLLPEGMSVAEAIQFLPGGLREQTEAAWDAKLSEMWNFIFKSTQEQIHKDMEEKGELERYNSMPPYAKHALTESVMRKQWNLPEVPLEGLIEKWANPPKDDESKTPLKKTKRRPKERRNAITPDLGAVVPVAHEPSSERETITNQPSTATSQPMPERSVPTNQTLSVSETAIEWNREHHRFLLRRLDQIWGYLDPEEQRAVREILNHPIGKEEIDLIDEIVKGVEWVRRLQR